MMTDAQTSASSEMDLTAILPLMLATAQQAGDLVLTMQAEGLANITSKSSASDLVTEADVACEKRIRSELQKHFPSIDFWGEESNQAPTSDYFWIVDPIDGTTNFANGLPYFAVNIALNQGPTTLLGLTLELPARNLYFAQLGQGAYRRAPGGNHGDGRDRQLHVNTVDSLDQAFLTTGFPYHSANDDDNNLAEFSHFLTSAQGVRCMGTSAMDLVNVADGNFGGYWEGWLNAWDAAPGVLMVREAGGEVTDYQGRPWQIHSRSLIASNGQPQLHAALIASIKEARKGINQRRLPASEEA